MAPRLTVVVSQSPNQNSAVSDIEETLVAELMLSPGLDATMVGPLERIEADDTDHLCLSSYQYNFALVSTLDAPSAQEAWDRLGLGGTIVDLGSADGAAGSSASAGGGEGKRILYLRLSANANVADVVSQLRELLAARNVKPVSIGGLAKTPPKSNSAADPVQKSKPARQESASIVQADSDLASPSNVAPRASVVQSVEVDEEADEEWPHLDQLVDDLDDLDL